jgi:hypothetical protein
MAKKTPAEDQGGGNAARRARERDGRNGAGGDRGRRCAPLPDTKTAPGMLPPQDMVSKVDWVSEPGLKLT